MPTPLLPRFVLTTVGTSLLTNRASPEDQRRLRDFANKRDLDEAERSLVSKRAADAAAAIEASDAAARDRSAELNGLLGFYEGRAADLPRDMHCLVATDTAQGRATAEIIETFLRARGARHVEIVAPPGFSTGDATGYANGVRALLRFCAETVRGYRDSGHTVIFNTIGGFKSQRDILNIAGMFYADEILYVFEGPGSPLIRVPRLPIRIDRELFADHAVECALLARGLPVGGKAGAVPEWIPETLLDAPDPSGARLLSTWGELVWDQVKDDLLSGEPLDFPMIRYEPSYRRDFDGLPANDGRRARVLVQETVAEVSAALIESGGDTRPLFARKGLGFEHFQGANRAYAHFRVTNAQGGLRISCEPLGGGMGLALRHVGAHDAVNDRP